MMILVSRAIAAFLVVLIAVSLPGCGGGNAGEDVAGGSVGRDSAMQNEVAADAPAKSEGNLKLNLEILENVGKTLDEAMESMPDLQYVSRRAEFEKSIETGENSFLFPVQGGHPNLVFGNMDRGFAYCILGTGIFFQALEENDDPIDDIDPKTVSQGKEIEDVQGYVGSLVQGMPESLPLGDFLDALGVKKIRYLHDLSGSLESGNLMFNTGEYRIRIHCRDAESDGPRTIRSDFPMFACIETDNGQAPYDYHKLLETYAVLSFEEAVETLKDKYPIGDDDTVEYAQMFFDRYIAVPAAPFYLPYSSFVLKVTEAGKTREKDYLPHYYAIKATTGEAEQIEYPGLVIDTIDGSGIDIRSSPESTDAQAVIAFIPSGRTDVILIGPGAEMEGTQYNSADGTWSKDGHLWCQVEIPEWYRETTASAGINDQTASVGWVRKDLVKENK